MAAHSPDLRTDIPARLDRLPWSAWHWRVVIALGVSWLLDGLEVTVVGSLGPALQRPETLGLSAGQIGWAASAYIGGAVLGALYFGRLADKLGRKRMFLVTLVVYLIATVLTAFTWDIYFLRLLPFPDRLRHRRRVRRDQLGDRRADPGAAARARRSRDQRHVLDRRGDGGGLEHRSSQSGLHWRRMGLAHRLRARRHPGVRHSAGAAPCAGKSALADDARPLRGGRGRGAADREGDRRQRQSGIGTWPSVPCARCHGAR